MIATPFSKQQYYPMILANGRDSILVDYSGSNFVSRNGHSHFEQHQGAPCGWYKGSHTSFTKKLPIQSIIAAGFGVILFGAPCEPDDYVQSFEACTATLTTCLTFNRNIKICVESFLNDDSLWCEALTVISCPEDIDLALCFNVSLPFSGMKALELPWEHSVNLRGKGDTISFDYTSNKIHGRGFLKASRVFEDIVFEGRVNNKPVMAGGYYYHVREGFCVSRVLTCVDESERCDTARMLAKRLELAKTGFGVLRHNHRNVWNKYFSASSIKIPDRKLQYIYELGRYVARANLHPKTGFVSLGMLPFLWGGGISCSYDSGFTHMAFLTSGNKNEADKYMKSFIETEGIGRRELQKHNIQGTTFAGWTDCYGEYMGYLDFFKWISNHKPCYGAYMVVSAYWEWLYGGRCSKPEVEPVLRGILQFWENEIIIRNGDKARIKKVKAGTEAGFDVETDTFTQLLFARGFQMAGEMLHNDGYKETGGKLMAGLSGNYSHEGILLPFQNAPYLGGLQFEFYMLTMPDAIDIINIDRMIEVGKTPWGFDNDQTTEVYRHWPWNHSRAAICYIHEGRSESAMENILSIPEYCSALGALPEKIRLDGTAIGYWYTTPHSMAVWAINDAFAFTERDDNIKLAYGFSAPWHDFECEGICLHNELSVSYAVENGILTRLVLKNSGGVKRRVKLEMNKAYSMSGCPDEFTVEAHDSYTYTQKEVLHHEPGYADEQVECQPVS